MIKVTRCKGEGQGSCRRCTNNGKWNRSWMCFLYKIEGFDGCYCSNCVSEIRKEMDGWYYWQINRRNLLTNISAMAGVIGKQVCVQEQITVNTQGVKSLLLWCLQHYQYLQEQLQWLYYSYCIYYKDLGRSRKCLPFLCVSALLLLSISFMSSAVSDWWTINLTNRIRMRASLTSCN